MLTKEQQNKLREAISDFVRREYGDELEPFEFQDMDHIPIAYTEIGDEEEHEIQMIVDAAELQLKQYVDGHLTDTWQYADFNCLLQEIEHISFDELVALGFNAERLIYGEDDGDC